MNSRHMHKSSQQISRELHAAIQSLYRLAPAAVIVGGLLFVDLALVAMQADSLMFNVVLVMVLVVALLIYRATSNYGEAALALAAGLLSTFAVQWDAGKFVAFVGAWVAFSGIALLMGSTRLAARVQAIHIQAAGAIGNPADAADIRKVAEQLEQVARGHPRGGLGPVEKAEVLRIFAYRRVPLEAMPGALGAVDTLSLATHTPAPAVAKFIADVFRLFDAARVKDLGQSIDTVLASIRESRVPPEDFFGAFERCRYLALRRPARLDTFFRELRVGLESGIPPERLADHLEEQLGSPGV